ncbi:MAG: alkaline phosphatase family protein [Alishewanella sp.]|nr:alkaline phosphatase family protein [Alishewanella sp.]
MTRAAEPSEPSTLPLVLAGPMLRALTPTTVTFWLATREPVQLQLTLSPTGQQPLSFDAAALSQYCRSIRCAEKLHLQLLQLPLTAALPQAVWISYDLQVAPRTSEPAKWQGWQQWAPDLVYAGRDNPGFIIQPKLQRLLHGSCRKPHADCEDGLLAADLLLQQQEVTEWPALLLLSGDQIYADDVAAPMLQAIHQLINQLGFHNENLPCSRVSDADTLHQQTPHYYQRHTLLPKTKASEAMLSQVFRGVKKPVFTTDTARNHLISAAEMLGMYLLVWSPAGWQPDSMALSSTLKSQLSQDELERYQQQQQLIETFAAGLAKVRRVLAHLPTAMIFDDHDVSDDWNLTAEWEKTAYEHDFSRRIIGNALLSYLLCQGWGNKPADFASALLDRVEQALAHSGGPEHEALISELLEFQQWHYQWPTEPPLLVLDTRTRRWRSEVNINRPSGLLDWEAITELQQNLLGHDAVVLVAPAPIFGVKLIENIQKIFTFFGRPLLVDAENWMAHRGTAHAMLNLFRHPKTPKHFVILSGDVHYSFVYEVHLRSKAAGPDIWQITSSGLKNQFPSRLLDILDRLNRWLYSPRSPLNWLTKRRRMRIVPHKPDNAQRGERLLNQAGIGLVDLHEDGSPKRIAQLTCAGKAIDFIIKKEEARWE